MSELSQRCVICALCKRTKISAINVPLIYKFARFFFCLLLYPQEKEDNKDRLIKCVNSTQTDMVDDVDESEETNTSDNIGTDVVYGREHMLEKLLVLMDSAANLGIGPNPDELGKRQLSSVGTLSNSPSTKKGIIKK